MTKTEIIAYLRVHADAKEQIAISAPGSTFDKDAAALREAAELLKAVPEWISVKDKLPKAGIKKLLVAFGIPDERVVDMARFVDGVFILSSWTIPQDIITHWMPLPEPPKGGGRE